MASQNENQPGENSSSSSGEIERVTVAYTESALETGSSDSSEFSSSGFERSGYASTTSSSGHTSMQESDTSLFATLNLHQEKELHFGYEPVWRTMSWSQGPKLHALDYFRSHSIFQLFSFLMSHLLANTPEEPVQFLVDLLDRCLQYRDRGADPPLLFQNSHVHSVYSALDPGEDGAITYSQFLAGMSTLGLTQFNVMPECLGKSRDVPKDVFIDEAKLALLEQLDLFLGKSHATGPSKSEVNVDYDTQQNINDDSEGASTEETVGKRSTANENRGKTSGSTVESSKNTGSHKISFNSKDLIVDS